MTGLFELDINSEACGLCVINQNDMKFEQQVIQMMNSFNDESGTRMTTLGVLLVQIIPSISNNTSEIQRVTEGDLLVRILQI